LLYATGVSLGPPESSTQTASRSLQPLLQGSLGDRQTDRPTDHAIRPLTIGGAHSGKPNSVIVYGYSKYLLEQSTRHIGTTAISSYIAYYVAVFVIVGNASNVITSTNGLITGPKAWWRGVVVASLV